MALESFLRISAGNRCFGYQQPLWVESWRKKLRLLKDNRLRVRNSQQNYLPEKKKGLAMANREAFFK